MKSNDHLIFMLWVVMLAPPAMGQVDESQQKSIIDSISREIDRNYLYPEAAARFSRVLNENYATGKYRKASEPALFANRLTEDLRGIGNDLHWQVEYDPRTSLPSTQSVDGVSNSQASPDLVRDNYYIQTISHLKGNVGYLRLNGFAPREFLEKPLKEAMESLAHSDAVIVDLRSNYGGSADSVRLVASYFFAQAHPVRLLSFYNGATRTTRTDETEPVDGNGTLATAALYVLTSGRTASGGEGFAFSMQVTKRGKVIGEATTGANHSVVTRSVGAGFIVRIPSSRVFDPVSGKDWETVGGQPDELVTSHEAMQQAYVEALQNLLARDQDKATLQELGWWLAQARAELEQQCSLPAARWKDFVGQYGERSILLEGSDLYFQRSGRKKMRLIPLSAELFYMEWERITRVHFVGNIGIKATAIELIYDDGTSESFRRSE